MLNHFGVKAGYCPLYLGLRRANCPLYPNIIEIFSSADFQFWLPRMLIFICIYICIYLLYVIFIYICRATDTYIYDISLPQFSRKRPKKATPTRAVSQKGIYQSWFEVLSNGVIPFPNYSQILQDNTNSFLKTAFQNGLVFTRLYTMPKSLQE